MDHVDRPSLYDRHLQRLEHELGAQVCRHRPADDLPAEDIEDRVDTRSRIEPFGAGLAPKVGEREVARLRGHRVCVHAERQLRVRVAELLRQRIERPASSARVANVWRAAWSLSGRTPCFCAFGGPDPKTA